MTLLRRTLILLILAIWPGWVMASAWSARKYEEGGKELLLSVQEALQDFHVDQERYLPRLEMSGTELITVLLDFGFLNEPPVNPATGKAYALDGIEPDFLIYRTDERFETYSLQLIDRDGEDVLLEIDSVEHQSLE